MTKRIDRQPDAIASAPDVPVFGIGPAVALASELAGRRPDDLLPGARSLDMAPQTVRESRTVA